jgi:dephospho-CoA kinase
MILIILRGPMGSGKSEVGRYLREKLKGSAKLDLDINANGEVSSLDEVLGKEYVTDELYDGGSYTTDPQSVVMVSMDYFQ